MCKIIEVAIPPALTKELQETLKSSEGFKQISYPEDVTEEFQQLLEDTLKKALPSIKNVGSGRINSVKKIDGLVNGFGWHIEEEDGVDMPYGHYLVMWASGDTGKGGDFLYIDDEHMIQRIDFKPKQFAILKGDTLHSVEDYNGHLPRVTLNLNIQLKQD